VIGKLDGTTVAIVVGQEFEDIELLYPIIWFSGKGARVIVATPPPGQTG
jgi:hypothetical protein